MFVASSPHPAADLVEVIDGALAREARLFAAGELAILRVFLEIDAEARELWARLSLRTAPDDPMTPEGGIAEPPWPRVFRVAALRYDLDPVAAVARLQVAGLAHTTIAPDRCLPAFDVPALRAACRRLSLPSSGGRPVLVERLRGRRWVDEAVVLLAHTELVRRAELLYFQRPHVDRTSLVVERLGQLRWPDYVPTGGPGLFRDRASLLQYERARSGAWADAGEPLRMVLAAGSSGPASPPQEADSPLSARRRALEAVLATDPSATVLRQLVDAGAPVRPRLALRLEAEGRAGDALGVCRAGDPDRAEDLALERTGQRLARSLGEGWVPREPLLGAPVRRFWLPAGPRPEVRRPGARPTWWVDGEAVFVEEAAIRVVARAGRRAIHAENWLWTSLYALVFRDLYFLPVPGMLPTARREGPLDVGRPAFYLQRRAAVDARLAALREVGPAPFAAGWSGERLAGLYAGDVALAACAAIPGATAAGVLGRLAREGWAAARGLPDLYIFSGLPTRLGGAVPARLNDRDLLAEIKGPGDALRDEQRLWHDYLVRIGIHVELWGFAVGSQDIA